MKNNYLQYCCIASFVLLQASTLQAKPDDVESLYMQVCYVCHGDDGRGNMPGVPDLADNNNLFTDSEQALVERCYN